MIFEWDDHKEQINIAKHGIDFKTAARVFQDEFRIEGRCIMIVRQEIDFNEPLTDSQVKILHELAERPVTPDEDCPELTAAQLSEFKKVSENRRAERCKQTVTLRLSPQALKKAKSLGKGYTSILSRILENALDNPDIIHHNLSKTAVLSFQDGFFYKLEEKGRYSRFHTARRFINCLRLHVR